MRQTTRLKYAVLWVCCLITSQVCVVTQDRLFGITDAQLRISEERIGSCDSRSNVLSNKDTPVKVSLLSPTLNGDKGLCGV
jgi:hypothetical protein